MKLFIVLFSTLLAISLGACQPEAPQDPQFDLTNMDLSGMAEGMFGPKVAIDFSGMNAQERSQAVTDFLAEFREEMETMKEEGVIDETHAFPFNLKITHEALIVDIDDLIEVAPPRNSASANAIAPLPFAPSCPDGWGQTTCWSEECVTEAVQDAFSSISRPGDCMDVRVVIGWGGASVCSHSC